jgi:hypothetical protein
MTSIFGNSPYGQSGYGVSLDAVAIAAVVPVDPFTTNVLFSGSAADNPDLVDPTNYVWTNPLGATVTTDSVDILTYAGSGVSSIRLNHTGTTFGVTYTLTVSNVTSVTASPLAPNTGVILGQDSGLYADPQITVLDDAISIEFREDFYDLVEAVDPTNYDITTAYVIPAVIQTITALGDTIDVDFIQMTTTQYEFVVGSSKAILYDVSEMPQLPDQYPLEFTAIEIGTTGISTIFGNTLQMISGTSAYGWEFLDTTGRLQAGSSYRITVTQDLSLNSYPPGSYTTISMTVRDGSDSIYINLSHNSGSTFLEVVTPFFNTIAIYDWTQGEFTLSISNNSLTGLFVVSIDGVPYFSIPRSSLVNPTTGTPPGFSYQINPYLMSSKTARIRGVLVTASSTLFTISQNFIHYFPLTFTAISSSAVTFIETAKGPLVKTWGDYTPAGIDDVEVRLNGTPYPLLGVNPYAGKIFLNPPIPKVPNPPGAISVEVDYHYMEDSSFGMLLNVEGLGLNDYTRPYGRFSTGPSGPLFPVNPDEQRHPLRAMLGPGITFTQPITTGYRFLGYELAQTAMLNRGDTLLLNSGAASHFYKPERYNPDVNDIRLIGEALDPPWELTGGIAWTGVVGVPPSEAGYLTDPNAYAILPVNAQVSSRLQYVARVRANSSSLTGVWSGVAFGATISGRSVIAGLLKINQVDHVGIYTGGNPALVTSWYPGQDLQGELLSYTSLSVPLSAPADLYIGGRFQIFSGVQAGIYEITSVIPTSTEITIGFTPAVPVNPFLWGSSPVNLIPETKWTDRVTTMRVSAYENTVSVYVAADITANFSTPYPSVNFLPEYETDTFFFGQPSGESSAATWNFLYFSTLPTTSPVYEEESAALVDMTDLLSEGWFPTSYRGWGFERKVAGSEYRLRRYDAALAAQTVTTLESSLNFQPSYGGFGPVGATMVIRDRKRVFQVDFLTLYESLGTRVLARGNSATASALQPFTGMVVSGPYLIVNSLTGIINGILTGGNIPSFPQNKLLKFVAMYYGDDSIIIGAAFGGIEIGIRWQANGVISLTNFSGTVISSSPPGQWAEGQEILYTLSYDGTTVTLDQDIENSFTLVVAEPAASFPATLESDRVKILSINASGSATAVIPWISGGENLFAGFSTAVRTVGIKVSDTGDFNRDYVLPMNTLATASLPNSNAAKDILVLPWDTNPLTVRLHLDPTWGGVIEIPSSGFPSWYSSDFATQSTNPYRGYCTVEYAKLPFDPIPVGYMEFGAGDSHVVTFATAFGGSTNVKYQIRGVSNRQYQTTRSMVLNKAHTLHSGELNEDSTPESVQVYSGDQLTISLLDVNYRASLVYQVIDDGTVRTDFAFNRDSQIVTMDSPLTSSTPVVVFIPAKPVTVSYLRSQPRSQTTLYQKTPPFVYSQTNSLARMILYGTDYNGVVTEIPSETISNPLTSYGYGNSGEYFSEITSFEYPDEGSTGAMASFQDVLTVFLLTP